MIGGEALQWFYVYIRRAMNIIFLVIMIIGLEYYVEQ